MRRRRPPLNLTLGGALVGLVVAAALLSFAWLPHDPQRMDFAAQLAGPSASHWFGTDHFGRDLFSRVLVGSRSTLLVGAIAVGIALSLGALLGAMAGWAGGWADEVVMRL
ncbi:MAG: ABC transporter permease, partial [Trueperaceae bacterium]